MMMMMIMMMMMMMMMMMNSVGDIYLVSDEADIRLNVRDDNLQQTSFSLVSQRDCSR